MLSTGPSCSRSTGFSILRAIAVNGTIDADTGGVCFAVVDEANGVESAAVDIPACELAFEAFGACISECSAASVCRDSPEVCECAPPSLIEGTACCWYPSCPTDGSLPSCYEVCGNCAAAS